MGLEALLSSQIIGLSEAIDDRTASLLVAGTGITLTYNDGAGTLTIASSGGLGGSTGSTDNRILRSDGTGGATVQGSAVTIDDSGNISGLALITSMRAGAMGPTNPQNQIVVYGGYAGYGIGFDNSGELVTCINSALRSRMGVHVSTGSLGGFRINATNDMQGAWDAQYLRNATGPSAEIRAAGGLRVCNAAGSGFANITLALMFVGAYTVATLPSAAANDGAFARVTDSSVTTNGSNVAGGGSSKVPVFSDGTNWIVK
jgi:hypothetical protein